MCISKFGTPRSEHGGEIFLGPNRVNPVTGTGGCDKGRRDVGGDRRRGAFGERRGARVNETDEIRARGDSGQGIGGRVDFRREVVEEKRGGRGEFGARGEAEQADLGGIEFPFRGVGADEADGLEGVVHGVDFGVVAVDAQAVAEDNDRDAVAGEERDESWPSGPIHRILWPPPAMTMMAAPLLARSGARCTSMLGLWMLSVLWTLPPGVTPPEVLL
jgi:hypothetical protein